MDYETGSFTVGFKAGGLLWGVGPEVSWGSANGTQWNDALQHMVAEYQAVSYTHLKLPTTRYV